MSAALDPERHGLRYPEADRAAAVTHVRELMAQGLTRIRAIRSAADRIGASSSSVRLWMRATPAKQSAPGPTGPDYTVIAQRTLFPGRAYAALTRAERTHAMHHARHLHAVADAVSA